MVECPEPGCAKSFDSEWGLRSHFSLMHRVFTGTLPSDARPFGEAWRVEDNSGHYLWAVSFKPERGLDAVPVALRQDIQRRLYKARYDPADSNRVLSVTLDLLESKGLLDFAEITEIEVASDRLR